MSELTIRLLGPPTIEIDGEPINVDTRKAIALLAYLAVLGDVQGRGTLAALFWPESDSTRARSALRRTLTALNKAIGKQWIEADRSTVQLLSIPGLFVDTRHFHELMEGCRPPEGSEAQMDCIQCLPRLEKAVALYRGDFLEDFSLPDSPGFGEWQFFEAESWRRETATALRLLVHCLGQIKQYEQAIQYARQWVALDFLHEPAHRELMRVYALAGQRSAAARHFEECRRLLAEELGVEPQEATTALFRRIMSGDLQPAPLPDTRRGGPATAEGGESPVAPALPRRLTSFVGRETELEEIDRLLDESLTSRLLTIVGPGGIGKTRLALETAQRRQQRHADGVYFIPLGAINGPDYLVPAIAEALSFSFYSPSGGNQTLKSQLFDYLRNKDLLLVLDNFEHLLDAANLLAELLEQAPTVRIVVTSQERLNLLGEYVVEIHGLVCPDPVGKNVEDTSAGRLFVERARQANTAFSLTEQSRADVARICSLVGGLPLGIELASTLVRVLSPAEIATQIEANLDFLASTLRNVPERHRSLRAVFAYSWELLSAEERASFMRVSIFRAGFSVEAALEVAGASLPLLIALADKSLLHRRESGRFEIPEVLRAYALEKFETELAAAERQEVARRHSRYYLDFVAARATDLKGQRQSEALDTIAEEIENIRVAWRRAVKAGDAMALDEAVEPLFQFYQMRGWFSEGEEAFARAVQAASAGGATLLHGRALSRLGRLQVRQARMLDGGETLQQALAILRELDAPREVAAVLSILGVIAETEGDDDRAEQYQEQSLDTYREVDDRRGIADVLLRLGNVQYMRGHYQEARQYYSDSLALRRLLGDLRGVALCLNNLGSILESMGEYDEAHELYRESAAIKRQIGDRRGVAYSLNNLGHLNCLLGAYDNSQTNLEESLTLFREIGDRRGVAYALTNLGNVAYARQNYQDATRLYEESLAISQSLGFRVGVAYALNHLGNVYRMRQMLAEARQAYRGALEEARAVGSEPVVLEILVEIADLLLRENRPQDAAALLVAIRSKAAARQRTKAMVESLMVELQEVLPADVLAAAEKHARALEIDQIWADK